VPRSRTFRSGSPIDRQLADTGLRRAHLARRRVRDHSAGIERGLGEAREAVESARAEAAGRVGRAEGAAPRSSTVAARLRRFAVRWKAWRAAVAARGAAGGDGGPGGMARAYRVEG
jgi:hypothetical protein